VYQACFETLSVWTTANTTYNSTQLTCDMTHSYVWHNAFVCDRYVSETLSAWTTANTTQHRKYNYDMTHSYVWRDVLVCDRHVSETLCAFCLAWRQQTISRRPLHAGVCDMCAVMCVRARVLCVVCMRVCVCVLTANNISTTLALRCVWHVCCCVCVCACVLCAVCVCVCVGVSGDSKQYLENPYPQVCVIRV